MRKAVLNKKMTKNLFTTFVFAIVLVFCFQNISAQEIKITLPKFPKLKKEKPKIETAPSNDDQSPSSNQPENNKSNEPKTEQQPAKQDDCSDIVLRVYVEDAIKQQKEVESFTPGRGYLVNFYNDKHLLYAVSPKARQEKYENGNFSSFLKCTDLTSVYEKLAESGAKKIPQYVPDKSEYSPAPPAMEKFLKGAVDDLANHKIFYSGIREANWLISKNDFDIPKARFKHALVWAKHNGDDHPYCWIYYINLVQDYAGGGSYGATFARFIKADLAGCPAGTK